MKLIFSTEGFSSKNSFQRWQEVIFDRIVPIDQTRIGDRPFEGKLEAADVGPLLITRISQGAMRTAITPSTMRRRDKGEVLSLGIRLAGIASAIQDDRESTQHVGDLCVIDHRPAVMISSEESQSLFLELPRERIEGILGPSRFYTSLTIDAAQASTALTRTFFTELIRVRAQLTASALERMTSIGVDLIIASIAERLSQELPRSLQGNVIVQRAKAYIEANIGDSALDPPNLAAAVGVSLRRLQELFHERGRHISDWIWQRRLETASMRLADFGFSHLSIGTIAYECGFTSQAHFSRRFKEYNGMTPREYRQIHLSK